MSPLEALASGGDDGQTASRPIITITDAALGKLLELRADESDADQLGLRLAIASEPGEDFRYDLSCLLYTSPRRRECWDSSWAVLLC